MNTTQTQVISKLTGNKNKTAHFIGIGGIGMSGIARMYLWQGYQVRGSDLQKNGVLSQLETLGAKILIGHDASFVEGADVVIYSSSIGEHHPERMAARDLGITLLHRSEALAGLCEGKFTVAVTGTHGKTTTTSLMGMIFKEDKRDPTVVVGGLVKAFGGNACQGAGREMIIEADESDSSFLRFEPDLEIITNIEEEHLDHFQTIANEMEAYQKFISRLKTGGCWIGCAEDARVLTLAKEPAFPCILYGFDGRLADYHAADIVECPARQRGLAFSAWHKDQFLGSVRMRVIGRHNVLNALAAIAACRQLGISWQSIKDGLAKYEGAARRFEVKYEDEDRMVVDDYAHHPTEIRKTLEAAKAIGRNRLLVFFQPHRYSRTELLMPLFARSFAAADKLIVTDIYAAGEKPRPGIHAQKLCEMIKQAGQTDVTYVERGKLSEVARGLLMPGDLAITMGAGDVCRVSDELAAFCQSQPNSSPRKELCRIQGKVFFNEALSRHTSFKIGGPASFWIEPADEADLGRALLVCRQLHKKVVVFGLGSNLLVSDGGLEAAVIHLGSPVFKQFRVAREGIVAGAGLALSHFIQFAVEMGFGGFEFLSGIPGSVGGAVAMNAGSRDQWIGSILDRVRVVMFDGEEKILKGDEMFFSYRSCGLQEAVIVEVFFKLPLASQEITRQRLEAMRLYRIKTQDLRNPSAGCVFKNPSPGVSCGQLIERAGLKGLRIGDAQISEMHGNFIVNRGRATAQDVLSLARKVQESIKQRFDIDLESEIKILE